MASVATQFTPFSGETWRNPFQMYATLRDHDPVHYVEAGDYWVLSRYADVAAAACDTSLFSSARGLTFTYDDMAVAGLDEVAPMVMQDPPEHGELRRMVTSGFTPRRVTAVEPDIRSFVVDRLAALRTASSADVVAELLKPLPTFIVGRYLGVPESDQEKFDGWTQGIVAANALGDPLAAADTVTELFGYFGELIERRRTEPSDDVISALVTASESSGLSPLRILGFAFTMVTGGNDTTTGLLGGALELLTEHPEQRTLLAADPSLLPQAVEEFLRLTSPVQMLGRTTTSEVTIHGATIPPDKKVMLLYAAANRDPREYGANAADLDVRRQPTRVLSFGVGAHHCLGAAAARLMATVTLEELLRAYPHFEVDAAAGKFAPGHFVRRYESLPFSAEPPS
jgi:cytochrome P450